MILDYPCEIDGCSAHVDLIKAELDTESTDWIHYFNCLSGHHYIKISENLLVDADDLYEVSDDNEVHYEQTTLFDEDGDSALD